MKKKRDFIDTRDLPVEKGMIPDYTEIAARTEQFSEEYYNKLEQEREGRISTLRKISGKKDSAERFHRFVCEVKSRLEQVPGVSTPFSLSGPRIAGSALVPYRDRALVANRYEFTEPGSAGLPAGFLTLTLPKHKEGSLLLLLGDACGTLYGSDSPAEVAARWGYGFASAGYRVVIPDIPGMRNISSSRNKELIIKGSCVTGEIVRQALNVFDAALGLFDADSGCVWVGGSGLGGIAALMMTVLDTRIRGCLSADAPRRGDLDTEPALIIPDAHTRVDMGSVVAAAAPACLVLVETGVCPWGSSDRPLAWADRPASLSRKASGTGKDTYIRIRSRGYTRNMIARLVRWMKKQLPGKRPECRTRKTRAAANNRTVRIRIDTYTSLAKWKRDRQELKEDFFARLGQSPRHRPSMVCTVASDERDDCIREEIDVWSSSHTGAKVLFLKPKHPCDKPPPTVLCLPGSSSHAGRTEERYAHEIIARGWNAAVVDCRARIYRHFPGTRAGKVLVGMSVYDQLCVMDYLTGRKDVDPGRIGAMGLSQGGIHAWMLAALDERVSVSVPVCGVASYQSIIDEIRDEHYDNTMMSFLDSHGFYYYIPGMLQRAEQADLMGLIAPRPLLILGGNRDHCFPESGIRSVYASLNKLYGLYNEGDRLSIYLYNGPHSMPALLRNRAYRFFEKHL